ncbi:MAG: hypothetical protein OZ935_10255 [Pseudomonadota bacterium]|nr:hypothetical protein [Pseudomonadota bacterium]
MRVDPVERDVDGRTVGVEPGGSLGKRFPMIAIEVAGIGALAAAREGSKLDHVGRIEQGRERREHHRLVGLRRQDGSRNRAHWPTPSPASRRLRA